MQHVIAKHSDLAHLLAGPDAALHLPDDQRIAGVDIVGLPVYRAQPCVGHAQILHHGLQFALEVGLAGGTVVGMARQHQLHGHGPAVFQLRVLCCHAHPRRHRRFAGADRLRRAVRFDDAEAAVALHRQVRVGTQVRNVDSGSQGGLQHRLSPDGLHRSAVDVDRDSFHVHQLL